MKRNRLARILLGSLPILLLVYLGCKTQATRPYREPPPPGIRATNIQYADSDAFDTFLESALVNQDPVIVIQTGQQKPEWGGRLNAWIAAWNRGGKVEAPDPKRKVRMQAPLPGVAVNADSIKEFRLLIDDLMDRVEDLAGKGSAWWAEEKVRSYRVALLKPYNLRFHLDENQHIQIILFNGQYSQYYQKFVQSIASPEGDRIEGWTRGYFCSRSNQPQP